MLRGIRGVGSRVRRLRAPVWLRPDAFGLLVVVLVLGGAAIGGLAAADVIESEPAPNPGSHPTPPSPVAELQPRLVAQRVERLRDLEFWRVPPVQILGPTRFEMALRDIALRQKQGPHKQRSKHVKREGQAGHYLLKLTDVVPPDFEFGQADQELGLEVLGVYDPVRKRVLIPRQLVQRGADVAQGYLAHELTHALDDQHFGVELPDNADPYADSTAAFQALGEGDASYVQSLYAQRFGSSTLSARKQLRAQAAALSVPLTPPLTQAALFPYVDGPKFIAALHGRGGWKLVDRAWRSQPPKTTQQILHPAAYYAQVMPVSVPVPPANALGPDWRSVAAGSITEEDTRVLMTVGLREAVSTRIANGWRGARFEVWRRRGAPACIAACRQDTAAVEVWRWRTARAAALFAGGLHDYALLGFLAKPAGPLTWKVDDGYMSALPLAHASAIAFAPDAGRARQLAKTAALRAE